MINCPIEGLLENGDFTNISAYFLGAILSGDESYRGYGQQRKTWLAVVKHNAGYCSSTQLKAHCDALMSLAEKLTATIYSKDQLVAKNWFTPNKIGFAVGFESNNDVSIAELISFTEIILPSLSDETKNCLLLGAFDGRCSIDINKATGDIRYLVLDCGNDQSMDFLTKMLDKLCIRYNCNYARDRLEGGIPRKPQLRIAAASVGTYAYRIGFISNARMEILRHAVGLCYEEISDDTILPGKKVLRHFNVPRTEVGLQRNQTETFQQTMSKPPIVTVREMRDNVSSPQLNVSIGNKVTHKVFGIGDVVAIDGGYISVDFDGTQKKFAFPKAFIDKFLVLSE